MTILLVEHYPPLAKALVRGLAEEGIAAQVARDDMEADVRARAIPYAALVVDWKVPRRGGAALVRSWRQVGITAPVLLLVPSGSDADRLAGLAAGADETLPLPFSFEHFLARLRAWIEPPEAWPGAGARPLSAGKSAAAR
jgi:two-component system OmpR family response regulator